MRSPLTTKTALIGSVLAGVGASVCCIGPLLLLSSGISGAWISHLTAFEPFRPVFIVLTLVFLGLAFRKLYLMPQTCAVGDTCDAERTRTTQRMMFWILAPITVGLVASPLIMSFFYR